MEKNIFKNGGFPPINYCQVEAKETKDDKTTKERFFANAPRQNINIRQLLSETKKKPIIITNESNDDGLEIIDEL